MENGSSTAQLSWIDFVVIALYFIVILGVGLLSSYKSKRSSVQGYFLASRSMHWIPVGASLFASNIGSGHFIGLAGSGAASGIGIAAFELNAIFILMVLGWIFVPVYMAAGVYTMPEYLRLRFGGQRIRIFLAILALILYVFTKISADLYAGALFIQLAMGLNSDEGLYVSIGVLLAISAIFTIAGGLTAVIFTDLVQTILMLVGAFILMGLSLNAVGGYNELIRKYPEANPSPNATLFDSNNRSCGAVPDDAMHLFKDINAGKSDLPWTGVIFGVTISSIWYWCSDQVIVQRVLASKNMSHAKGGCMLAGYLKLLPMYLLVFPGMAARVLYTDRVACAHPDVCKEICGSTTGCSNIAYAELVMNLMPVGLAGMMMAVMMAALMSSLTSIFNSSSTIFTIDIWTRIRKNPSETEQLIVGRLFVIFLVFVSIVWVIIIISSSSTSKLFTYIQSITSYLAPPVCAVYISAILIPLVNEQGAFWGLVIGLLLGALRFIVEFSFVGPVCGEDSEDGRPEFIRVFLEDVHYLHYGCFLFVITLLITYIISILTDPIDPRKLHRLTFWTRHSQEVRQSLDDETDTQEANINDVIAKEHRVEKDVTMLKKMFNCLCGIDDGKSEEDNNEPNLSPEEEASAAAKFLDETKFWKRFINTNALFLMIVAIFFWGFYA